MTLKTAVKKRIEETFRSELYAVQALKKSTDKHFYKAVILLKKRKGKIILTGVGKSGFIGMKIAATLTSLGHHAIFLHPVEALHGDSGAVGKGDVLIALSFSGETPEVLKLGRYLRQAFSVPIIAITGNKHSSLSKLAAVSVVFTVKDEGSPLGLAPMASTTATLVLGDLIACALTEPRDFHAKHFAKFHPEGSLGLSLTPVGKIMKKGERMPLADESLALQKTLSIMTKKGLGVIGIVNHAKKLTGIMTDGDVRRFLLTHTTTEGKSAKDAMTKNPKIIRESQSLKDALSLMERFRITSLFAIDANRKPVGILHMHDIIERNLVV